MKISPRVFTLEEANALLPDLDGRLARLIEKKETYARLHDELLMRELIVQTEEHQGVLPEPASLETAIRELEGTVLDLEKEIDQIYQLGCVLRNLDRGWVDFLSKREGEMIYYCWRRGEKDIQFYHALQCDFAKRYPIT